MPTYSQQPDGSWAEATPLPGTRLFRIEAALRKRGYTVLAAIIAWWDERGLRG